MHAKCDSEDFHMFVSIARRISLRRKAFIHEGVFLHPNIITEKAKQEMELLKALTDGEKKKQASAGDPSSTSWKAPPQGWFKAN
jgi:hypothetical protein